jgi:hypothetical protein
MSAVPAADRTLSLPVFLFPGAVLFVGDLLHPVDDLAVEFFLNGDMRHGGGGRSAVPVFFAGREPHNVAGPDLLDRSAFALCAAAASCHN